MCMEDVRIGRKSRMVEGTTPITTVSAQIVPPSPNRVALLLPAPLAGTVTYSTRSPVVSGAGINLANGQFPLLLDIQHHGAMVTEGWYAIMTAGSIGAGVMQVLLEDQ